MSLEKEIMERVWKENNDNIPKVIMDEPFYWAECKSWFANDLQGGTVRTPSKIWYEDMNCSLNGHKLYKLSELYYKELEREIL